MQIEVGAVLTGKVTGITKFGAFIDLGEGKTGMVHISEVASTYVEDIKDHLTMGQEVKVKVINVGEDGKISLSIKRAVERQDDRGSRGRTGGSSSPRAEWAPRRQENMSFEDMLNKFKQTSDEKMSDLKRSNDKFGSYSRRGSHK